MKNLLNLGKALNKAEQKQIFGGRNYLTDCNGGGGDFQDTIDCGGGSDTDGCSSDADCANIATQVEIPFEDCPYASQQLFGGCGYETQYVQGTCTQVSAGGSKICIA